MLHARGDLKMMSTLPYMGFHKVRQQKFYEISSNQDYQIYIF